MQIRTYVPLIHVQRCIVVNPINSPTLVNQVPPCTPWSRQQLRHQQESRPLWHSDCCDRPIKLWTTLGQSYDYKYMYSTFNVFNIMKIQNEFWNTVMLTGYQVTQTYVNRIANQNKCMSLILVKATKHYFCFLRYVSDCKITLNFLSRFTLQNNKPSFAWKPTLLWCSNFLLYSSI